MYIYSVEYIYLHSNVDTTRFYGGSRDEKRKSYARSHQYESGSSFAAATFHVCLSFYGSIVA